MTGMELALVRVSLEAPKMAGDGGVQFEFGIDPAKKKSFLDEVVTKTTYRIEEQKDDGFQ